MPRFRDIEGPLGPTTELAVTFTGRESDLAYEIIEGDKKYWIPFSQTTERHGVLKGGEGTIVITEWIAAKKGLI